VFIGCPDLATQALPFHTQRRAAEGPAVHPFKWSEAHKPLVSPASPTKPNQPKSPKMASKVEVSCHHSGAGDPGNATFAP